MTARPDPTPPALATIDRDRLLKCLRLLGSDKDGEALAAGRAAHRFLTKRGIDWDAIIVEPRPGNGLWDWRAAADAVLATRRATDWERNFCRSLRTWRGPVLTARQEETLRKIHLKYYEAAA
jgi:hypothetical protein